MWENSPALTNISKLRKRKRDCKTKNEAENKMKREEAVESRDRPCFKERERLKRKFTILLN